MGAEPDNLPRATATAVGGSEMVRLINQLLVSIWHVSVPVLGCYMSMALGM